MRTVPVSLLLICVLIPLVPFARATSYHIRPDGTGDFPTIQSGLNAISEGDTINLSDGTFNGAGNRDLDFLGKAITLRSLGGDPQTCVIDCEEQSRGLSFHSGEGRDSRIDGIQIRRGYVSQSMNGAGLYCIGSSPSISNCMIRECVVHAFDGGSGGGVYCMQSSPLFVKCEFSVNQALYGYSTAGYGAACMCVEGNPVFIDCTFRQNVASRSGGGIYSENCSLMVENGLFLENEALGGAGICMELSHVELSNCAFEGNRAEYSGALIMNGCNGLISYCTFIGNLSEDYAGAMSCNWSAFPIVQNCTFSENSSARNASGILCTESSSPTFLNTIIAFGASGPGMICGDATCAPILVCCDIYGNEGGDWTGCIEDQLGVGGNISNDPLFCNLAAGDLRLAEDSPCSPFSPPNVECDLIGAWPIGCAPMGVRQDDPDPAQMCLFASVPNPFTTKAHLTYYLPGDVSVPVTLRVHDVSGRLIRTLVNTYQPPGQHQVTWDGTDREGMTLSGGLYFYLLTAGDRIHKRHVLLTR